MRLQESPQAIDSIQSLTGTIKSLNDSMSFDC